MTVVGYARVSSLGQDLTVQLEKLSGCDKVFKEKRSGVDAGRPALKACLEYLREGDTLVVTKLCPFHLRPLSHCLRTDAEGRRVQGARRSVDRHKFAHRQACHGHFGVDCRVRERYPPRAPTGWNQQAKAAGIRFGPKPILTLPVIEKIKALRADGATVPEIMRRTKLSKASVYRALGGATQAAAG